MGESSTGVSKLSGEFEPLKIPLLIGHYRGSYYISVLLGDDDNPHIRGTYQPTSHGSWLVITGDPKVPPQERGAILARVKVGGTKLETGTYFKSFNVFCFGKWWLSHFFVKGKMMVNQKS